MPQKTIHLIRHAQGYHNSTADISLPDPDLTPLGHAQCRQLHKHLSDSTRVSPTATIIVSPLTRTLQTALGSFHGPDDDRVLIAWPELQEVMDVPCNIGQDKDSLEARFNEKKAVIDFGRVKKGWQYKVGANAWSKSRERARTVRKMLYTRDDEEIIVVTHGDFINDLTGAGYYDAVWDNTELRTFSFPDLIDDDFRLVLQPEWKDKYISGMDAELSPEDNLEQHKMELTGDPVIDQIKMGEASTRQIVKEEAVPA